MLDGWKFLAGPGDNDLLDLTAIQALINGGVVYAVSPEQIPGRASLAAVCVIDTRKHLAGAHTAVPAVG